MLSLTIEEKLVGIITFISIIIIMNKQLVISRHKIVPIHEWLVYLLSVYFLVVYSGAFKDISSSLLHSSFCLSEPSFTGWREKGTAPLFCESFHSGIVTLLSCDNMLSLSLSFSLYCYNNNRFTWSQCQIVI